MRILFSICFLLCLFTLKAQVCRPTLSVYFSSNSAQLDQVNQTKLQYFLDSLGTSGEYMVEIIGFTDSVGSEQANHALADRRAKIVQGAILKRGVKYRSIQRIAKGELSPRYSNNTEEKRARNRRVDLALFPVNQGKIVLKGDRGIEIEVDARYFDPCSVCETNPKLVEIMN